MQSRNAAIEFAGSVGWCTRLPVALKEDLLATARFRLLEPNARLYAIGDDTGPMYFLARGCLAAEVAPSFTLPQKSMLLYPGAWLGEGTTAVSRRQVGIWATRPSAILSIELGDFRRVARQHPDLWRYLALLALENHYRTMGLAHDLMIRGGRRRLSAILARMAGLRDEVVPEPLLIDATQAEVADIANLARSVVSGFLKAMEDDGLLRLNWGGIEILQPQTLLRNAEMH
jgi:CRP/FNR family transcriptional regulator, cyclic AMP receptor protein